jgi:REP element-mobilizing transposase RayT
MARGYFVSTVGINENTIKRYIQNQRDEEEEKERQLRLWKEV